MPEAFATAETRSLGTSIPGGQAHDILGSTPPGDAPKAALICHDRPITYQELHSEVARLACGLRENFRMGDLLAIWLPNCPELLCLYLACLKTGVVPMPLHQGMKWPEVREILNHTKAKRLITSKRMVDPHAANISDTGLDRIYLIERDEPPTPYHSYTELTENDGDFQGVPIAPESLGLVLHTSGSNGRAKGVMLSYRNIDHILQYRLAHTKLTSDSVSIVASCLTQSVGFYQSLALLAAGGTMVLLESYDADRMVDCIHQYQPTHLIMVVDAFDKLLHHPRVTEASLRSLVFAAAGADRVTSRVQNRFMELTGRPLRVSYGMTESSWALINSGDRVDKSLALGKPCPGIEVSLLGTDGREVPTGEVGQICIKSPRTMLGYLHDDELTRAAFADGWLVSGDLAYRDMEGYFWFAGRQKNIIVLSSGDNVSPVEVENVILSHPAVSQCAVLGVAAPHGSEVPWAFVTRLDETLSEATLDEFLRQRISAYKIPQRIEFLAELPVGLTGKVLMRSLKPEFNGGSGARPEDSPRPLAVIEGDGSMDLPGGKLLDFEPGFHPSADRAAIPRVPNHR